MTGHAVGPQNRMTGILVSDRYRYVYVAIPRTASKSVNHWLLDHYPGRSHGGYHQMDVPEEARDYLVFTIVRNPYDLWVSYRFHVPWGDSGVTVTEEEMGPCGSDRERRARKMEILETKTETRPRPLTPPTISLEERIAKARTDTHGGNLQMQQIRRAGVNLVLYYERLPDCLAELPFVDGGDLPPLPHHPERGVRPAGDFFDIFPAEEEQVVWAAACEDFSVFHYCRGEPGLPVGAPSALWIR